MNSSLTEWLIAHYGREEMKRDTGLSRMREALKDLLPELNQKKILTIAGTNGKGETTLWLSRSLAHRSHCTWMSPHIERITERFRDENGEISEEELKSLVEEAHQKVQENKYSLSFYEFLFHVFCLWARKKNPELLLLEVGLGGRLDAVNVFDADLLLVPSIARDHQEFLGNRYDLILREKLALLRKKTQLMTYFSSVYLQEKTSEIVKAIGAEWIDLEKEWPERFFEFSFRNQLLARAAFLFLEGKPHSELKKFIPTREFLEHRGEVSRERGEWIFYGSHNVDGMRKLIQFLQSGNYNFGRPPYDAVLVAFSRREPRDLRAMLKMLKASGLGEVIVTGFPHQKAADPVMMKELSGLEGIKFVDDPQDLIGNNEKVRTLVTGSYYFMGHVKSLLRGR